MKSVKRCRHYHSWIICGGVAEWCWECGAYRGLKIVGPAQVKARTTWVRPTGIGGKNPWDKMREIDRIPTPKVMVPVEFEPEDPEEGGFVQ